MPSWNICHVKKGEYELLNGNSTLVHFSPTSDPDVAWLMNKMEELEIPISYTKNLNELYFTKLPRDAGDYLDGRIRLSVRKSDWVNVHRTFIHELGHLLDDHEALTDDDDLKKEKKKKAKHLPDSYAKKDIYEYLAVGFEIFYCGTKKEKKNMKKKNPILFKKIKNLHKKYSKL